MSAPMRMRLTKKSKSSKKEDWRAFLKTDSDKFGEAAVALRGLRYRDGLTQQDLAEKLGIYRHHISEMENGKRSISKEMAKKLGNVFNVNYKLFL